jgi:hypothetical protein
MSAEPYKQELRSLAISDELIEWFDVSSRRTQGEFDVYVDTMAFKDDLEYLEAARWYPKERDDKAKNLRHGYFLYGLHFSASIFLLLANYFHWPKSAPSELHAPLNFLIDLSVLLAPICSPLAFWKIAKAKRLNYVSNLLILALFWCVSPMGLIILWSKDNNILNEPVPSKHHDLLCRLRGLLAEEREAEDKSQHLNLAPEPAPSVSVLEPKDPEPPRDTQQATDNEDLEKLFELFRSGAISETEFKRLREKFQK